MGQREARVRAPVRRIGFEGAFEIAACLGVCLDSPALQTLEASQPAVVCVQAGQRRTLGRSQPGPVDADLQRAGNLFRNLVLHREQRPRGDVVAIGPELAPRVGVEQLDRDADHVAGSTDTAAQEVGSVRRGVAATASWRCCRERLGVHDSMAPKRESAEATSSTNPSASTSCEGSPDRFSNGARAMLAAMADIEALTANTPILPGQNSI